MKPKEIFEIESDVSLTILREVERRIDEKIETEIKHTVDISDREIRYIKDLITQDKQYVKEALEITAKANDEHFDKLNHAHEYHEKTLAKMEAAAISGDKFEGLANRVKSLEDYKNKNEGASKVADVIKYLVGVFIGSMITGLIFYFLNK